MIPISTTVINDIKSEIMFKYDDKDIITDKLYEIFTNSVVILEQSAIPFIEGEDDLYKSTFEINFFINTKPLSMIDDVYPVVSEVRRILKNINNGYGIEYKGHQLSYNKGAIVIHFLVEVITNG